MRLGVLEDRTLLSGTAAAAAVYGNLPLAFEANVGQAAAGVNYLAHGGTYNLNLSAQGATLAPTPGTSGSGFTVGLAGANPQARAAGANELITKTNYLVGNDPAQWHTNIPNYGQVEYQNVYPGIDVTYYGNQGRLEYDFTVAPGANASAIRMNVQGASGLSLDAAGDLVIHTAGSDFTEQAPVVYQVIHGVRQAVAGHFVLLPGSSSGTNEVGFELGAYNHSQALVIDPVLVYSFTLSDTIFADTIDGSGDAYFTGYGNGEVVVGELNAAGTALVWQTYLGSTGTLPYGDAIALNAAGDVCITGSGGANYPTTANALSTVEGNNFDVMTELNPSGSGLLYSTVIPGGQYDITQFGVDGGIAVDGAGNIYVTGSATAAFPATANGYDTTCGGQNAYLAEFNPSLSGTASLVYGSFLTATSTSDGGTAIALDSAGNAYITGITLAADFPTTAGAFQRTYGGGGRTDCFVAKFDTALSGAASLIYSTYLGGSGSDGLVLGGGYTSGIDPFNPGPGIAVDSSGDVYVAGETDSTDFPITSGAFQTTYAGPAQSGSSLNNTNLGGDAFVTKFNPTGSALVYSTYLGGSANDGATSVAVNAQGDATLTGFTLSTNFPLASPLQSTNGGASDAFVTTMNASGSGLLFSTYLGGSGKDIGCGVALDSSGNIYVAGFTRFTPGFIDKISTAASPSFSVTGFPSPTTAGVAHTITVTALNADGTVNTGYTGTVTFSSSDPQAALPASSMLTNGTGTFSVALETAGSQSITVTDTTTNTITGSEQGIVVQPAAASRFIVSAPSSVKSGSKFSITVTADDAYGNVATGYTGTVHFTSSDSKATLPPNYTFTTANAGTHTFSNAFVLKTTGTKTITVTDTKNSALTGTASIQVSTTSPAIVKGNGSLNPAAATSAPASSSAPASGVVASSGDAGAALTPEVADQLFASLDPNAMADAAGLADPLLAGMDVDAISDLIAPSRRRRY